MTEIVLAFDPNRSTNAQAIVDCVTLGYLHEYDDVLDATYGKGRFWNLWRPDRGGELWCNDLYAPARYNFDFKALPGVWKATFDAVAFDPDYKLTGNSQDHQTGSGTLNADYGLDRPYKPVSQLQAEHNEGMRECVRVTKPKGYVLFKTMAQVVSGEKHWIDMDIRDWAKHLGCRLVDQLYVVGHRKQPDRKCPECKGHGFVDGVSYPTDYGTGIEYDATPCPTCSDGVETGTGKVPFVQKHSASNVSVLQIYMKVT